MRKKGQLTATKQGDKQGIQHTEEIDDNLLPDAAEIEKLHILDPDILSWLKHRAEQEQNFRHNAHSTRVTLIDKQNRREHYTGRMALICYFLLVAGCVTASYFLLRDGHSVQGSILGGASVVLAFAVLISRRPKNETESK